MLKKSIILTMIHKLIVYHLFNCVQLNQMCFNGICSVSNSNTTDMPQMSTTLSPNMTQTTTMSTNMTQTTTMSANNMINTTTMISNSTEMMANSTQINTNSSVTPSSV